jgi:hypothetical protein
LSTTKLNEISDTNVSHIQRTFKNCQYLIIDEKSMISLRMIAFIGKRLRQAFPHREIYHLVV